MLRPLCPAVALVSVCMFASAQQAAAPPTELPAAKPSSLVRPAIDRVAEAGSAVDLNKWKTSNATRQEVDGNLLSMQKDIQGTLPPLLSASDAAPASVSATLRVLLNLDALYSVLLRVTIASRGAASREETASLEQSAMTLDNARRDLGDQILTMTKQQEKRIADLQATVQQQANTPAPPAKAAPPAPATKSKKRKTSN